MENKISVILPCYNEELIIEDIVKKVAYFAKENPQYEFIFVDDGSKDKTLIKINSMLKNLKTNSIKVISYDKNAGKGYAIRKGIQSAKGNLICFTDSDLAYSLDHLHSLTDKLNSFDVVIGCRALVPDNVKKIDLFKVIRGKTYNLFSRLILGLPYLDMQAGLKGFTKSSAKKLFEKQRIEDFSFDVEILYLAKKYKYKIGEIPANVSESHKSMVSQTRLIRDPYRMLTNLFNIKLNDLRGKYA